MTAKKRHAGETAKVGSARALSWRTVRTKVGTALRSPDGRCYYGTAKEIREAALVPSARCSLAGSMRLYRLMRDNGAISGDKCRTICAERRRDAIFSRRLDEMFASISIPTASYLKLRAGARLLGLSFKEYIGDTISGLENAILDVAESETGKREIPLTRYEKAALMRLESIDTEPLNAGR